MKKIIYKVTNKINNKIYIGKTISGLDVRKYHHLYNAFKKKQKLHFYNAIRKYGEKNFTWEIVEECNSNEDLNLAEEWYIRYYNSYNSNGYNSTKGGDGGNTKSKRYVILKPSGDVLIIQNLSKFCRNNNLELRHMRELYIKSPIRKQHKGYKCRLINNNDIKTLIDEMRNEIKKTKEIIYVITSPDGIEYNFITLIEAEKKLKKSWQFFGRLCRYNKVIKGWKCIKIKDSLKGYEKRSYKKY